METLIDSGGVPHPAAGALWLAPSLSLSPRVDGGGNPLGGYVLGAASASVFVQPSGGAAALAGTLAFPASIVTVANGVATFNFSAYATSAAVAATYLPLAGGTLTGRLNTALATFTAGWVADGVWDPTTTRPLMMPTAGGAKLVFGYHDSGSGEYVPSIGFGAVNGGWYTPSLLILQSRVAFAFGSGTADSFNRFQVGHAGAISWGSGASAVDVRMERESAGVLKTWNPAGGSHTLHVAGALTTDGLLTATAGARIYVNAGVNGTNARGIFLWSDTNWGIYMATSGPGVSLGNGTACGPDGITDYAMRFRIYPGATQGFIWENASEQRLMSLSATGGKLTTGGDIVVGGSISATATGAALSFGNRIAQLVNLWGTQYGIGIQSSTLYMRSDGYFAWHLGGTHAPAQIDPGPNGTLLMQLGADALRVNVQFISNTLTYLISPSYGSALQMWNDGTPNNAQSIGAGLPGQATSSSSMIFGQYTPATGWVEVARFKNARLGIGTTDPFSVHNYARLVVSTSDSVASYIAVQNTGAGQAGLQWSRSGAVPCAWIAYVPAGEDAFAIFSGTAAGNRLKFTPSATSFTGDVSASGTFTAATVVATGYSWAAAGFYLSPYGQYVLPVAADRIAFQSGSSAAAYLRFQTSGASVCGFVGGDTSQFGLWGADAGAGVLVRSDRVRIYRTPYENWNGADYLVAKVIVSTVAPSASDVAPDGTLWCQV